MNVKRCAALCAALLAMAPASAAAMKSPYHGTYLGVVSGRGVRADIYFRIVDGRVFDISFIDGSGPGPDFNWRSGRMYRCGARRLSLDSVVYWPTGLKLRGSHFGMAKNVRHGADFFEQRMSARLSNGGSALVGSYFAHYTASDVKSSFVCTIRFQFSAAKSNWYFRGITATGDKFGFWLYWPGKGKATVERDRADGVDSCWPDPIGVFDIDHASGSDRYRGWSATFPTYAQLAAGNATATGTFTAADGIACNTSWTATLNPDRR